MSVDQIEAPAIALDAQTKAPRSKVNIPSDVVYRLHEAVSHVEDSVDQAYVSTAEFAMLMPSMRNRAQLSFGTAEVPMNKATEALHYLTLARQAIRESHDSLNVIARKNGIDLRADYPFGGK
jgi:hypothetical protein